ncbi:MAG TPA: hypothetical protein VF743_12680, partial [Acidimicrobiales bacterium]
ATNPTPPFGSLMEAATRSVDEFDPEVVAVYVNHNYWPPYPRDAAGHQIVEGSPAFREMAHAQLRELVRRLSARGAAVFLVKPVPEGMATAEENPIWSAYMEVRDELGFGVIDSGDVLASPTGHRVETVADCAGQPVAVRPPGDLHLTYHGSGIMGTATARALAQVVGVPVEGMRSPTDAPAAMMPLGSGYRLVTCDGATFGFGVAAGRYAGDDPADARPSGDPVVAATVAPPGDRSWAVTRGGRILGYGGAPHLGEVAGLAPGERAVGIVATPTGAGYWVATSAGAVRPFGDADTIGDLAGQGEEVVGMAGTPDGRGYWLLARSGRVAAFGTATPQGDMRGAPPPDDLVAIAAHPGGQGYWLLDRAGNVHPFGDAEDLGSAAAQDMVRLQTWHDVHDFVTEEVPASEAPTLAVTMLPTVSGHGYWIWLANGAVCRFGDAHALGGLHTAEVDQLMLYFHVPYYGNGPCAQDVGFGAIAGLEVLGRSNATIPVPQL